ncbi:putative ABC transporter, P-loop containing nucleoside triphosphate hydrolase [Helianthus anomalus]
MKDHGVGEDRLLLLKGVSSAFEARCSHSSTGCGYIERDVKISGYPKGKTTFARIFSYCEQNDIHSPHVTVYESLLCLISLFKKFLFTSFRNGDYCFKNLQMFVDEVMDLMELIMINDALVRLPGVNGLSTNQRKMLTIIVELVANLSILFMDEPTLELDVRAAAIVMRTWLQPL